MRHATLNGFDVRFDTKLISPEREASGTTVSLVEGIITKETYKIRSKYPFGCDGTRSQVLRESKIPLIKKTGQGLAINILAKVDLSHTVEH